ncbi:Uncharacterized protein OS=Cyclobacterium marinum (strain ATCC 25205 / DSM 745) GN=Cycma_0223 PE=4 SV=1 [Gemmataceae bacterium]|nr:Uncharacterized protein OS=Cyclobacterium marinum (strain ATCC 25205 / DSM 745) GN=Cycma_0223 PE=4 SV=1 [Gemmataceae bacterium]VTT98914.1 Uncharacterized protein OS=Cyclobacterium marinum (strain ATCC 25205 / DSM 745) GN=Cycma_0223 PE=4 SV=1 [Gemmataceae bacterium]
MTQKTKKPAAKKPAAKRKPQTPPRPPRAVKAVPPGPGDELARVTAERDKLAEFKAYVHARMDAAGVPVDPDGPHKAEGCRVGGRLDLVLAAWRHQQEQKLAAPAPPPFDGSTPFLTTTAGRIDKTPTPAQESAP